MNYQGTIIEESLENLEVLKHVKVINKKISPVTAKSKTPWLKQWTQDFVEIEESKADEVVELLSKSIEFEHESSWYADFLNEQMHYIVFKNKIFKVDRKNKQQYDIAFEYGLSVGIPEYQLITFESQKGMEERRRIKYDN